jgi:hypothetical protein
MKSRQDETVFFYRVGNEAQGYGGKPRMVAVSRLAEVPNPHGRLAS